MTAIKPLQTVCSNASCRLRQTVPADRIWFVDVRKGPGSHRAAGWICRKCKHENVTPPAFLPKGMLGQLPSRARVEERHAAPPPPPLPVWAMGAHGRAELIDALRRLSEHGGDALAMGVVDGRFEPIEVESLPANMPKGQDLSSMADLLLAELDRLRAEFLVLGGAVGGAEWRMVLNPRAGAASFV